MEHHHQPTTIAILGTDTLAEDILAKLLRDEGYDTRLLEAYPTGLVSELLDGVDVLLLTPGLDDGVRECFLGALKSTPETSSIPVLSLSAAFEEALLDELAVGVSWRHQFEQLVRDIEDDLGGRMPAGSAEPPPAEEV